MSEQLKLCPFCGGKAKIIGEQPMAIAAAYPYYFAQCTKCGAETQGYELESFTNRDAYSISVHKAIAAWNRRVT